MHVFLPPSPLLLLAAALLACAPPVGAAPAGMPSTQELAALSLDSLLDMPVTGASKFASTMTEAAASVTVISAEDIRAFGYRTLADVLSSVRGVMVTSDRSYSYLGVRGFFAPGDYNTRVLLLIDGVRVNDNIYDQATIGSEFPLDIEEIERVEFIPGQASAVYGANALFGVINVVTRAAGSAAPLSATVTVGSEGARRLRLASSLRTPDGRALQWSASRSIVRGENVVADGAVTPHGDFEERNALYLQLSHGEFTATALHSQRNRGAPALIDALAGDPRTRNVDIESLFDLTWTHPFEYGDQVTWRAFAGQYRFVGFYALEGPPVIVNEDIAVGHWWGTEGRFSTARWTDHKIIVGGELQLAPELFQTNFDAGPPGDPKLVDHHTSRRAALFAEDQFKLTPAWTLDTSMRRDHIAGYADQSSARVALSWKPVDALVTKLITGTAFRAPNAFEAYYHVPGAGGYRLNPALRSESVRGTELDAEWRPAATDRLSAAIYQNSVHQLIVQMRDDDADEYMFGNQGRVIARGAEMEWEHAWNDGVRAKGNLSLQRAEDRGTLVPLAIYAPHVMANFTAVFPVFDSARLGLQWQAVSRRGAAGGYALANVTLSSLLNRHGWSWSVSAFNVLDRRHDDPGTDLEAQPVIPQDGARLDVSLGYAF